MFKHSFIIALALGVVACGGGSGNNGSPDGGVGDTCEVASQCNPAFRCIAQKCEAAGSVQANGACSASPDCAAGLYCSSLTQMCAPAGSGIEQAACSTDGDCSNGLRCDYSGFTGRCDPGGVGDIGGACQGQQQCLPGLYCAANGLCGTYANAFPPFAGASCPDDSGAFRAYFEVPRPTQPPADFFRLPYPNDIRVAGASTLDISDFPEPGLSAAGVDIVKLYVDALTTDFDGFSSNARITVRFSKDIDCANNCATLTSNMKLLDLTAGGTTGLGFSIFYTNQKTKYSCQNRLSVSTGFSKPFIPGHQYALVIMNGVRSKTAEMPAQDPDLVAVLGATQPSDASLAHAWTVFTPLRALYGMGTNPFTKDNIATATVFTVANMTGHMQRLATAVNAIAAPVISDSAMCGSTSGASTCDAIDAAHACPATVSPDFYEIHGRFHDPIFQQGLEPYLTSGGNIMENGSGVPQLATNEDVCFALTIPKGGALPGSFPFMVYSHGTGGNMRDFINDGIADAMANDPARVAVLSFDSVEHGQRRGTSTASPDDLVFNALNPRAARDNFLQGAADILTAFKIQSSTLSVSGVPGFTLSATNPTFFGHSQGATSGELALPYWTANPAAAVLSGAGASLTQSILHKTSPANILAGLELLVGDTLDANHPVIGLIQNYFDRSDPLNYNHVLIAAPVTHAKHVFMTWGTGDTYTPVPTLEANALSLGIPPVNPVLEDDAALANPISRPVSANLTGGITGAVFQYAPTTGDGHFVSTSVPAAVTDWTGFVHSFIGTGTPTVQ